MPANSPRKSPKGKDANEEDVSMDDIVRAVMDGCPNLTRKQAEQTVRDITDSFFKGLELQKKAPKN